LAKLQADLKEFIELLNSHGVDYILVGGHAVAFHGYPRFTGDIDFLIRITPANGQRLLAVLNDFGFGSLGISDCDLLEPRRVVRLGYPPNQIDILTSISGVDFDAAWASRIDSTMDGQRVSIIGWNELLRNKRASGRQKDLADVDKLLAVAKRKRR
jgi:predicted nucleotidyltransferase